MISSFLISQLLVGLAICTDILSFQFKKREKIVTCLLISCLLISSHFMLLGHWTAAGLGLIAAARFATSLFSTAKMYMWLFIATSIVVTFFTFAGLLSILGCAGAIFGTLASFCKKDKQLRQLIFIGTCLWIIHNSLAGSPAAVIMELLFLSSNVVGYFRYYIKPRKQILKSL